MRLYVFIFLLCWYSVSYYIYNTFLYPILIGYHLEKDLAKDFFPVIVCIKWNFSRKMNPHSSSPVKKGKQYEHGRLESMMLHTFVSCYNFSSKLPASQHSPFGHFTMPEKEDT